MKVLKGIVKVILIILLFNLIMLFASSFTTPKIITEGVLKNVVMNGFINSMMEETSGEKVSEDELNKLAKNKDIKKLMESKDTNRLLNKYFNVVIQGIASNNDAEDVNPEEDIIQFITNNRDVLQSISKEKITDEKIEELKEELRKDNINEEFQKFIKDGREQTPKEVQFVLKAYNFYISLTFRLIILVFIIIDVILIGLISSSRSGIFKIVGWCEIVSGFVNIVMGLGLKLLLEKVLISAIDELSLAEVSVDTSVLYIAGIILLVSGIILCIIGSILKKKKLNNNNVVNNKEEESESIMTYNEKTESSEEVE